MGKPKHWRAHISPPRYFRLGSFSLNGTTARGVTSKNLQSSQAGSRLCASVPRSPAFRPKPSRATETFERNSQGPFLEGHLNVQEALAPRSRRLDTRSFETDPRHRRADRLDWLQKNNPDAIVTTLPALRSLVSGLGLRVTEDAACRTTAPHSGGGTLGGRFQHAEALTATEPLRPQRSPRTPHKRLLGRRLRNRLRGSPRCAPTGDGNTPGGRPTSRGWPPRSGGCSPRESRRAPSR